MRHGRAAVCPAGTALWEGGGTAVSPQALKRAELKDSSCVRVRVRWLLFLSQVIAVTWLTAQTFKVENRYTGLHL